MGLFSTLFVVLLVLKLTGAAVLSWPMVFLPLFIPFILFAVFIIFAMVAAVISELIN